MLLCGLRGRKLTVIRDIFDLEGMWMRGLDVKDNGRHGAEEVRGTQRTVWCITNGDELYGW